jgi:ATP-dependent 26S proteasome regulatory subunit
MCFNFLLSPSLFSKYLGDTEANIRHIFNHARTVAPCVLFLDELDALGAKRGASDRPLNLSIINQRFSDWGMDGTSGVHERALSTLLNEMDGIEENNGVFVIGCTNRPDLIDDALLRPGTLCFLICMLLLCTNNNTIKVVWISCYILICLITRIENKFLIANFLGCRTTCRRRILRRLPNERVTLVEVTLNLC